MKRSISLILIFTLLLPLSINFVYADDEDEIKQLMPELYIESTQIPTANAGSDLVFSFKLKNSGRVSAKNIIITPEFSGENNPFILEGYNQTYNIESLNPNGSKEVKMTFGVSSTAIEGSYPVKLNFKYKNGFNISGEYSQNVNIRVVNLNKGPQLFISNIKTNPETLSPGSSAKLNINFDNKGNLAANDITITLDGLSNESFFLENGSNKEYVARINGKSSSYVNFNIKSNKNILPGGHELTVNFKYKSGNEIVEDSQKIYLNIGGKDGKNSNVNIENISFPTAQIRPGNSFVVRFNLKNTGLLDAKNLIIKAESTDEGVVPTSQNIRKLDRLAPGQSQQMVFAFTPTEAATTRNYPISISVEYEDELNENSENKYKLNQYAGIYVYNPPKKEKTDDGKKEDKPQAKPKLIIDKYSFQPQLVQAGENFTMNLSFYNTNAKKAVKNIKIFLTSDEKTEEDSGGGGSSVFTPVDTSNTFYIENIPPKGRVDKTIKMFTVPDAKAKTYTIVANFEYEDAEAKEYTATELIGVPVVQKSKLDIGQLNLPPEAYAFEPNPVNIEFYNTGKVTLYNLMVRLEGNFQKENATLFVGNFEMGSSEVFDATIIPNEPGEIEGEIVFSYEDSTGDTVEHREPFSLTVMEGNPMEEGMEEFPEEPPSNKKWIIVGSILAVIVVGLIGFKIYKKKKSKKEFDDLYDWDENLDMDKILEEDDKGKDKDEK